MAGQGKILIVDDEIDMQTFLRTLPETNGYQTFAAADAAEGIPMARTHRPGLVIINAIMPEEGGIRIYRGLKTDDELKHIPVIMLPNIGKKTFFGSQNMLRSHMAHSLPEPEAYLERPPEPEEPYALARSLLKPRA